MYSGMENLSFTAQDYYIFTKFKVYRGPEPDFFTSVEPVAKITYNGETAVWIYRGDTIANDTSYFE